MESHLIVVTDTFAKFVPVPRDAENAAELARHYDELVQPAKTQDEREFNQRAADYYWGLS